MGILLQALNYLLIINFSLFNFGSANEINLVLLELPWSREKVGVFWWWDHQNTPTYPVCHGDSQRPISLII